MTIFRRFLYSATPFVATSAFLYNQQEGHPLGRIAFAKAENDEKRWSPAFNAMFPREQWNKNWDFLEPFFMAKKNAKYDAATDEERKELEKTATPTATRFIYLVRHGQYHLDSETKHLTILGREQAELIGARLRNLPVTFDRLIYSTAMRATETAQIILNLFPELARKEDSIIVEGEPFPPTPYPNSKWDPEEAEFFADGARIEAAFRKYIHRASPKQTDSSHEIIVCHGNVIRYFVTRALQLPPESWLRMNLGNCSLTILQIRKDGQVSVKLVGDVGHLPPEKNTDE